MSKKSTITIIISLIVVLSSAFFVYRYFKIQEQERQRQENEERNAKIEKLNSELERIPEAVNEKKIAVVGDEFYFQTDLEHYAKQNLVGIEDVNKDEAYEWFLEESVILQGAENDGLIHLDESIFNNPYKDYDRRTRKVVKLRQTIEKQVVGGITVEALSVWFCNVNYGEYASEYGVEAAKKLAKNKLENVRKKVLDGMSMKGASKLIRNDKSLAALDDNYDGNAYIQTNFPGSIESIQDVRKGREFGNEGLYDFLKNANPGDISAIYLEKDNTNGDDVLDAYYAFYHYKKKNADSSAVDFEDWKEKVLEGIVIYNL